MKNFTDKQKKYLLKMFALIAVCEILLKINNAFMQSLGIILVPFIVTYGFLVLKNDSKSNLN